MYINIPQSFGRTLAAGVFALGLLWTPRTATAQSFTGLARPAHDSAASELPLLLQRAEENPMIAMKRYEASAAKHRIAMKSSLMNPMLMLGIDNLPTNSFRFDQEMMTSKTIGITQNFPFPGKLAAERSIAEQDTVTANSGIEESRAEVRRSVKKNYFELYHLAKAVETNESHLQSINELIRVAEERLAIGKSTQQAVLNLQLEAADMKTQILDGQTMEAMTRADLAGLSQTPESEIRIPSALLMPRVPYSLDQLDSIAALHNPGLATIRSTIAQTSAQIDRTLLDRYPNFDISLMYMQRDQLAADAPANPTNTPLSASMGMPPMPMKQTDLVSARISFELPLNFGNQRREAQGEFEAMRGMKQSELASRRIEIRSMLAAQLARLDGLRSERDIVTSEIHPLAVASLETSNANFTYDKADIEQVLRNELNVLHKEHLQFQLEAEYNKAIAEIEYLTGVELVDNRQ